MDASAGNSETRHHRNTGSGGEHYPTCVAMTSVKNRIILAIGTDVIERPRELQTKVDTDEHSIAHVLYALQKDGLTEFKKRRNLHSAGVNLTKIRLTKQGKKRYEELRHG